MPNPGSTTARGYGTQHQALRRELAPKVAAGDAHCTEPICHDPDGTGRWIAPGRPWDLAHNRDTGGYRGPAHQHCNRREGAEWRNAIARASVATLPPSEDWWA